MNRQRRFCKLFRLREDIRSQSSKIACPLDMEIFIFLNYCYLVCTVNKATVSTFFRLIVPLKSVRSLQSFLKVSA